MEHPVPEGVDLEESYKEAWMEAVEEYRFAEPYLQAGKPVPNKNQRNGMRINIACTKFYASRKEKREGGENTSGSWLA